MMYEYPPSQGKLNPLKTDRDEICGMLCRADLAADKFILDSFTGIGPLTAREAAYYTFGDTSRLTSAVTDSEKQRFADNIYGMFSKNQRRHVFTLSYLRQWQATRFQRRCNHPIRRRRVGAVRKREHGDRQVLCRQG